MAIVREATRVEAYRLAPPEGVDPFLVDTSPLEYQTTAGPVTLNSDLAETLQATLIAPQTYQRGRGESVRTSGLRREAVILPRQRAS